MIIVTGTKRSGTSMWMQILKEAGFPVLGRPFPRDWAETIRDANREGFYESPLRHGIYYATNPNPRTGAFLAPSATRRHAVKVFAQGLARTDLAYTDFVIASVRDYREYKASIERLYAMEHHNKLERAKREGRPPSSVPSLAFVPALLEWWHDNFTLIRDAALRRYPLRLVSYASVLRAPEQVIGDTLGWLGDGDGARALSAVKQHLRTQQAPPQRAARSVDDGFGPEHGALFDELYQRIDQGLSLEGAFKARLERAHDQLRPRIESAERQAREARRRERERVRDKTRAARPSQSDSG
jgi:hypothetical protein